jgi:hypothetical protein
MERERQSGRSGCNGASRASAPAIQVPLAERRVVRYKPPDERRILR